MKDKVENKNFMQPEKLTIKMVEDAVEKLHTEIGGHNIELIRNDILKGTQVIIKSGDKVYFSPDIKSGEVKVITLPDEELLLNKPPKINFYVEDNHSVVANQNVFNCENYFGNDK